MNKNKIGALLVGVTMLASCTDDAVVEVPEVAKVDEGCTIVLDLAKGADSRLALSPSGNSIKSVWSAEDGFNVVDQESNVHTFTIDPESAGSAKGVFHSSTTPGTDGYYEVYYPASIKSWNDFLGNISLRGQVQTGDDNISHLAERIVMRHYVAHYSDIRFINQDYETTIDKGNGAYTVYTTFASNLQKSSIWKLVGTNLPVDFQPVSMELEVSNSNRVTFYETNGGYYSDSRCQKMSMDLVGFDNDKDFTIYTVQTSFNTFFPEGSSLRLTVRDASGECYYSDKTFTSDTSISGGSVVTFRYSGDWKRGSNSNYESEGDYADEGKVVELQKATGLSEGMNPISIVFMGDGFSDRQIEDGTYEEVMKMGFDAFFSEEPYASFKDWFNVYYVVAASKKEGIIDQTTPNESTFGSYFGDGTFVGGNNGTVLDYTRKVESLKDVDMAALTSIVMLNSSKYAGTCYSYPPSLYGEYADSDYGMGYSVSYFPIGTSYEALRQTLTHEAGGHGFGKLADEYDSGGNGGCTADGLKEQNQIGWDLNVDTEGDPTKTIWSKFYEGDYKEIEGIGAYIGAYTWPADHNPPFYRPTENSIMRYNYGGYNAPSREAIYIRIHKMVYGEDWEYNFDEFKAWDAKNIQSHSSASVVDSRNMDGLPRVEFVPLAPPVIVYE